MSDKSYVRKLCDTIINGQPLSPDQLYFLVDIVTVCLYVCDEDCYEDLIRAKLFLKESASGCLDDDGRR